MVVLGHDSIGMETALAHIIPTLQAFGLEVTRLDMKLLANMLNKGAYDKSEVASPAAMDRPAYRQAPKSIAPCGNSITPR